MDGDLINIFGETNGTATTGTFTLNSEQFTNTPTEIAIPKGFKAKVWSVELSGAACDVFLEVSKDAGVTWTKVKAYKLASAGQLDTEKRSRPKVILSELPYVAGTSGVLIRFTWSQTTPAKTYLEAVIEIVKDN